MKDSVLSYIVSGATEPAQQQLSTMNQVTPIPEGSKDVIPLTKGDVFKLLSQNIPLNQFHLPDHIYRSDLIDNNVMNLPPKDKALILDSASLPITFEHGYPAILENQPLWERLPAEPPEAFGAYMAFLELPEKSNSENPIRLLPMIATLTKQSLKQVTDWCHQYYWHWRARAYDLFLIAAHRKKREQRMMTIEGKHFDLADKLLDKIVQAAGIKLDAELTELSGDPTAQTETKVKDLITMAKDLVGIQRVAIGMPASGPSSITLQLDGPRHTSVQDTFKHIAKEGAGDSTPSQRSAEMDSLLANPDDLDAVQELMIRLHNPQHTLPAWGSGKVVEAERAKREPSTPSLDYDDQVEDLGNPN